METIAVFADDAEYARHIVQPMLNGSMPTHWVVVACAPRLTHRISKWVSHSAREQWRSKWAAKLFDDLLPTFKAQPGTSVEAMLAKGPLVDISKSLRSRFAEVRVLDARRPKLGHTSEVLDVEQPAAQAPNWTYPVAVTSGLSVVLALAD